jgi:hypothetical protein
MQGIQSCHGQRGWELDILCFVVVLVVAAAPDTEKDTRNIIFDKLVESASNPVT